MGIFFPSSIWNIFFLTSNVFKFSNNFSTISNYQKKQCYFIWFTIFMFSLLRSSLFCSSFFRKKNRLSLSFMLRDINGQNLNSMGRNSGIFGSQLDQLVLQNYIGIRFILSIIPFDELKLLLFLCWFCSSLYFTIFSMTAAVLRMCSSTRALEINSNVVETLSGYNRSNAKMPSNENAMQSRLFDALTVCVVIFYTFVWFNWSLS